MPLTFDNIPSGIRTPGQFLEFSNARAVQGSEQHIALIIAQRLAAGTVAALVPTLVPSGELAETYFGAGSHAAEMCRAFKRANGATPLWVIALNDAGGSVARTVTLTVTGPATAAGTIVLYIAGRRVTVAVASGAVQNTIATNINAAIQAHSDYGRMPVTSAVATNVVTLTFRNKGTVANGVDTRLNYQQGESLPAGVAVVIAQGVAGSGDPDITTATAVIGDVHYHTIASALPDSTNANALAAFLATKWGPTIQQDAQGFIGVLGNLSALQTIGDAFNSPHLTAFEIGGLLANSPTPSYIAAANVAAVDAREASNTINPGRPRQTLALTEVLPPAAGDRFSREERDTLLYSGIATHKVVAGAVQIERLITTYQTSPAALPDASYLDVERLRTLAQMRSEVRAMVAGKYPRHFLADDGTLYDSGMPVVTPSTITAELIALARSWEGRAMLENIEQFIADLLVERDATDKSRLNYRLAPDLTDGFRVGAGQIQFQP